MAEELEKKISKRKEKKRLRKQEQDLNIVSEGRWRRIGSFAAWAGYAVNMKDEQEVVPVRKNASRFELSTVTNNLKRYIRRKKEIEAEQQREKKRRVRVRKKGV
jgi:glutamate synthase domain-containing protein 2